MIVIGITGGSGSGKGYVCERFEKRGIHSVSADLVYRDVTKPGMPCLSELEQIFGGGVIREDGSLDRPVLAAIVFAPGASDKLKTLNSVTHKYVIAECERWLALREREGDIAAIIDAPQLFESGLDSRCDLVISVTADKKQRIERIMLRDGISEERAMARISAQLDDSFFGAHSDHVIDSSDGADIEAQIDEIVAHISRLTGGESDA